MIPDYLTEMLATFSDHADGLTSAELVTACNEVIATFTAIRNETLQEISKQNDERSLNE